MINRNTAAPTIAYAVRVPMGDGSAVWNVVCYDHANLPVAEFGCRDEAAARALADAMNDCVFVERL